jgi:hypothetical protein
VVISEVLLSINDTAKTDCVAAVKARPHSYEFCVMAAWLRAAFDVPDAPLRIKVTATANHNKTRMPLHRQYRRKPQDDPPTLQAFSRPARASESFVFATVGLFSAHPLNFSL